ncbi:MAG: fatty acid cis/trans isomerase [Comamonadaceae bacterium]|nr:fatty acid cis/trans isomerase [Comamonadaceae bacterium]
MRVLLTLVLLASFVGCATYYGHRLDRQYGPADPARYDRPSTAVAGIDFARDVKPVLDNRCVVCHGCYDAPCQLKLTAYDGVTRGANKDIVYDSARLVAAAPTRLFTDAASNAAWRHKGFYPVLNERAPDAAANRDGSVMYRMLALKRAHGLPAGAVLPEKDFDFALDRAQQCPRIEEMDQFEAKFPQWGMPYGLPALSEREHDTLARWIEAGAPNSEPAPLPAGYAERIAEWERFLNGDGLKAQLMSRYIYEHWFAGHLYFDDLPGHEVFALVRSATPPGTPIQLIASRRPYDDPGVARVYYRLRRHPETLLTKTYLPYALNAARMAKIKTWFLDAPYEVTALPSYQPEPASNPFITFRQLPVNARYRLMLEEAQFTLAGFMKGPVCRGQVALNVINDHFWIVFVDPEAGPAEYDAESLAQSLENLRLPAEQQSTAHLLTFRSYASAEEKFLRAKSDFMNRRLGPRTPPRLELLWNGDGSNANAALTGFRHFDSASVVQGLIGERPQTVLVIGYPLLERIHYLLVSGFDVYGNVGHQLATRLYMDFLRMEGEFNFLAFLPRAARQKVHDYWYREADPPHLEHLRNLAAYYNQETGIPFRSRDPLTEMYALMKDYYAPVSMSRYDVAASTLPAVARLTLRQLSTVRGPAATLMPETAFLTVYEPGGREHHITVLRNSAHLNVAAPFGEEKRRVPAEDQLLVMSGFVGAYPNAFYRVAAADLPQFARQVRGLHNESGYRALMTRYGIRRTDARFWAQSDALHEAYRAWAPREAGLFDYARFENR